MLGFQGDIDYFALDHPALATRGDGVRNDLPANTPDARGGFPGADLMKNPDRTTVARLEHLPNIGKAMAADLRLLGIERPQQLAGRDPLQLYHALERLTGQRHDPCVLDTFMAAIDFMEGGEARPWWLFTGERKCRYGHLLAMTKEGASAAQKA
jgi:hypothetical protein